MAVSFKTEQNNSDAPTHEALPHGAPATASSTSTSTDGGPAPLKPLLTVRQVAAFLSVSEKLVYTLVETRRISFFKISNRVRFSRDDLLTWLQENRVSAMEKSP